MPVLARTTPGISLPRGADLPERPGGPVQIGISECLTGEAVRYDGSGARSSMPHKDLEGLFQYQTFCPEVGIGMTVPRDPVRLVGSTESNRVLGVKDASIDKTDDLVQWGRAQISRIEPLSGYVFMHNSPSCGLFRVKVYPPGPDAPPKRGGTGAYAKTVIEALPNLPVEEGGRLFDAAIRENFVTRVYTYAHWQALEREGVTAGRLIAFHSRYKYLLMAHSVSAYGEAGRLLSNLKEDVDGKARTYVGILMAAMAQPATRKGHTNVLSHLQGYVKRELDSASRQELAGLIEAYRKGEMPLLAPLTLLKHHLRQFPDEYAAMQVYLNPHPPEKGLRRSL